MITISLGLPLLLLLLPSPPLPRFAHGLDSCTKADVFLDIPPPLRFWYALNVESLESLAMITTSLGLPPPPPPPRFAHVLDSCTKAVVLLDIPPPPPPRRCVHIKTMAVLLQRSSSICFLPPVEHGAQSSIEC